MSSNPSNTNADDTTLRAARLAASLGGASLLAGQIVAVTGASRGIGRAVIRAAAVQGARGVCIHCYGDEETKREARELVADVTWLTGGTCDTVVIEGDIANPAVGKQVRSADSDAAIREI